MIHPGSIQNNYYRIMAGRFLPLTAIVGVTILYAHNLSLENYGIFQSVWMYSNLVSVVLGFGISTIIFSTYAQTLLNFISENKKAVVLYYALLWILVIAIFWVIAPYKPLLKVSITAFILLQNLNTIWESWLIKNNGDKIYLKINFVYSALFFLWHYFILTHTYVLEDVLLGIVCISALKFLLLYLLRKFPESGRIGVINNRSFISNWVFTGANDVISVVSKWIDKLILIYLLTPADFAIYFNGSIEIPAVGIIVGMTGNYMMMQMSRGVPKKDLILPVFKENYLLLSSIVFPAFFFLLFFRQDLFLIFFSEKYLPALPVFVITILILPLRINHFGGILQVHSKGNILNRGALLELCAAVILVFVLFSLWGIRGAAMAPVISSLIQITYYLRQSAKVLGTSFWDLIPGIRLLVRFTAAGVSFFLLSLVLKRSSPPFALIAGLLFGGALVLVFGHSFIYQIFKNRQKS